jgi:hypothetical protein
MVCHYPLARALCTPREVFYPFREMVQICHAAIGPSFGTTLIARSNATQRSLATLGMTILVDSKRRLKVDSKRRLKKVSSRA